MQRIVDDGSFGRAYGVGEVVECLQLYLFDAAEAEKKLVCGFLADAGYVGECGAEGGARAFVFMEGDGEAVDFVLYLLEQVEKRVGGFELDDFD